MGTICQNQIRAIAHNALARQPIRGQHPAGIKRIVANTHHLADQITPHLKSRDVLLSHEASEILDTGGGLRKARSLLGENTVVTINPDVAWAGPNPIRALLDAWSPDMSALLLLVPLPSANTTRTTGDFSLEKGRIARKGVWIYTGAQIINMNRIDEIDRDVFSLNCLLYTSPSPRDS